MKSVYIVGKAFAGSFNKMFSAAGWAVVDSPDKADFLQFTGGADISPNLYRQPKHPTTHYNTERDKHECAMVQEWKGKKNLLGVCRGAQLFCALSGDSLYQDVDGHNRSHDIVDFESGEIIRVSSIHHQMMNPDQSKCQVLAVAHTSSVRESMSRSGDLIRDGVAGNSDIEAVFYPEGKMLCYQPHPEFGPDSCTSYYFKLIERCFK